MNPSSAVPPTPISPSTSRRTPHTLFALIFAAISAFTTQAQIDPQNWIHQFTTYTPDLLHNQPATLFAWQPREQLTADRLIHVPYLVRPTPADPAPTTFGHRWSGIFASSWWGWWEFNNSTYITPLLEPHTPPQYLQDEAAEALAIASESPNRLIREAAALALGRIKATNHTDILIKLTQDPHPAVHRAAFYALALLNSTEATEFLTKQREQLSLFDATSLVTALGLLNSPEPRAIEILKKAVAQPKYPDTATQAMWALLQLEPPDLRQICIDAIQTSKWPLVTHYAILGLGKTKHPQDSATLTLLAHKIHELQHQVPALPIPGRVLVARAHRSLSNAGTAAVHCSNLASAKPRKRCACTRSSLNCRARS